MDLPTESWTARDVWERLTPHERALAARALYDQERGGSRPRREADQAVARALRFREAFVRKLPVEQRVGYLLRAVRPDESLASALLLALHLGHRRPLLADLLERLGIPHSDGVIREDHPLAPPEPQALARAAAALFERFPSPEVEVYLATLAALDPDTWGALRAILAERRSG